MDDIRACLAALGGFLTITGVIYVFGRPETRYRADQARTLRWIQCFCGPEFFRNITIITTMWDETNKVSLLEWLGNLEKLKAEPDIVRLLDPPERYHGGCIYNHGIPGGNATNDSSALLFKDFHSKERGEELRNLIRLRYAAVSKTPAKLQFLSEIESGIPWTETQAAKVLGASVNQTEIQISNNRAIVVPNPGSITAQGPLLEGSSYKPAQERPQAKTQAEGEHTASGTGAAFAGGQGKQKEKPKEEPAQPEPSFAEKIFKWFEIAKETAIFFAKANLKGQAKSWKAVWGRLTDWWSGAPPEPDRS